MGKQIRLYVDSYDAKKLVAEIILKQNAEIIDRTSSKPEAQILTVDEVFAESPPSMFLYLVRSVDVSKVRYRPIQGQEHFAIDGLRSPVIEAMFRTVNQDVLPPSRLFFDAEYFDDSDKLIAKNQNFLLWASEIFLQVKKRLRFDKHIDSYVGEGAADLQKKGIAFATY